ncbi:MAG: glycosyltransferase family protein [Campylobacterota bacterium]|nr:glycosyltransferase family protein [Campylobacterota bacterium]
MKPKIIALLQARTDSTRLPKKVLKKILNKPMIIHQLIRASKSNLIDELVLVTSDNSSDDELSNIILNNNFKLFRGDKNNVLKRFNDCLINYNLQDEDIIVRLTGDCPLKDSDIIDELIVKFSNSNCDYISNCITPIYPDGFDVEIFSYKALTTAYKKATKLSQKEHVTPYIRDSGEFKIEELYKKPIYPNWRLTVDEKEDFILINKIFEYFGDNSFSFDEIITFLEKNQNLLELNSHINRNEGYSKSLKEENDK